MSFNKDQSAFHKHEQDDSPVPSRFKTPQNDDFFTDSLQDTSRIPTPSPIKRGLRGLPGSRARRAIGNTRTLKAAWGATAKPNRTSSSGSELARPQLQSLTPGSSQARQKAPPSPLNTNLSPTTRSQRARHVHEITSPISDTSSPPRGLTDVYQRIADEVDLADQERSEDDDEEEDYADETMSNSSYMNAAEQAQSNRLRGSQSPPSLQDSHRSTPRPYTLEADKENRKEQNTQFSDISGMSFIQGLTDQALAAKLTPHTIDRAKDRARLEKALNKESPIAFSRAKVGSKASMSAEDLRRNEKVEDENNTSNSLPESIATEMSDPPPNVPRTWGSRAKVGKDWLHRVHSRNGSPTTTISNAPAVESSNIDWTAAAADIPLPVQDDSSTPRGTSSITSTPRSLNQKSSLDKIPQWELNDFTTQSLQVSNSPPVRVRTMTVDQTREKEIENLEKRAVTTSRLGEIRRKDSREYLPRKNRSTSLSASKSENVDLTNSPEKGKSVKFEDDGEPIPGTPIVVYKNSTNDVKGDMRDHNEEKLLSHDRADSRGNLQRLARALSESPKPSSSPEDWSLIGKDEGNASGAEEQIHKIKEESDTHSDALGKSPKPSGTVEATPQGVTPPDFAKTPLITGAWTDTILPDTVKTARQQGKTLKYPQTPHVNAGGWIDTPKPNGMRQSSAQAPIPVEDISNGLEGELGKALSPVVRNEARKSANRASDQKLPDLPRSALAGLLDKAKRKLASPENDTMKERNDTLNLGDATIESLEDLLTLDNADMTTLIRMGAEFEAREQILNSEAKDTGGETELLERLGIKLERLRTNIHDARKGISKLEHQVSQSESDGYQKPSNLAAPCESCGCNRGLISDAVLSSPRQKFYLTLPRLWHPLRRDLGHWFPRPTMLGWITLLAWTWYLSESTMCDLYCHPLYADFYDWPDEAEPKWGWALPTMMWRWSRIREFAPVLLGPFWTLVVALTRIVSQAFGLSDGFVHAWPPGAARGSSSSASLSSSSSHDIPQQQPVALDPRIPRPSWGPDLSMMNDEYL